LPKDEPEVIDLNTSELNVNLIIDFLVEWMKNKDQRKKEIGIFEK
jgi:hypothetical protein